MKQCHQNNAIKFSVKIPFVDKKIQYKREYFNQFGLLSKQLWTENNQNEKFVDFRFTSRTIIGRSPSDN